MTDGTEVAKMWRCGVGANDGSGFGKRSLPFIDLDKQRTLPLCYNYRNISN